MSPREAEDLTEMLRYTAEHSASDLHLKAGCAPRIRVEGRLLETDLAVLLPPDTERIAAAITPPRRAAELVERFETDFAYELDGLGRFRVNVFRQQEATGLILRRIPPRIRSMRELGLPAVVECLADQPNGLVLVTGRAGSGKTTTLATMIDWINARYERHILTVEDPVEVRHADQRSLINQREIGTDAVDFPQALRRVLRQDPDVILIGEIRDAETAQVAVAAAETGHLVLSSLHTIDATETVNRLLELSPVRRQDQARLSLAASLRGIISQRLLPRADGNGRVLATEVLVSTGRVFEKIAEPDHTHELESIIRDGVHYGMQTFDQCLADLYESGAVTRRDALRAASHPHDLRLALDQLDGARAS